MRTTSFGIAFPSSIQKEIRTTARYRSARLFGSLNIFTYLIKRHSNFLFKEWTKFTWNFVERRLRLTGGDKFINTGERKSNA